jgi:hypothetical protein
MADRWQAKLARRSPRPAVGSPIGGSIDGMLYYEREA